MFVCCTLNVYIVSAEDRPRCCIIDELIYYSIARNELDPNKVLHRIQSCHSATLIYTRHNPGAHATDFTHPSPAHTTSCEGWCPRHSPFLSLRHSYTDQVFFLSVLLSQSGPFWCSLLLLFLVLSYSSFPSRPTARSHTTRPTPITSVQSLECSASNQIDQVSPHIHLHLHATTKPNISQPVSNIRHIHPSVHPLTISAHHLQIVLSHRTRNVSPSHPGARASHPLETNANDVSDDD